MAKAPDEADGRVRDVMSPSSHAFDEGHLLVDALDEMKGPPVGGVVPVIAGDGRLRGLLVRRDGIEALRQDWNRSHDRRCVGVGPARTKG